MKNNKKYFYYGLIVVVLIISFFITKSLIDNKEDFNQGIKDITQYCESKASYKVAKESCQDSILGIDNKTLEAQKQSLTKSCLENNILLNNCEQILEDFTREKLDLVDNCTMETTKAFVDSNITRECIETFTDLQKTMGTLRLNSQGELYYPDLE